MNSPLALALAAALVSFPAAADEIPITAFSPDAVSINFDDLAGGANVFTGEVLTSQYSAQGVTFLNPTLESRANTNIAALLATNTDPNIIWVNQGGGSIPGTPPQEIHFATPQHRVGLFYATSPGATFTIRVFNGNTELEAITKTGSPLGAFGLEGWVGIERMEGITKVHLSSASADPSFGPFNFNFDDLLFESAGDPPCYANCDGSTADPVLNVADFSCFLQRFAAGDPYANCDNSTAEPTLNVADFSCFLQAFAVGCP